MFNSDPISHLIKSCNEEAHRVLQIISSRNKESNMLNFGKLSISINDGVMKNPVIETMRIIVAMSIELN